MRKKALIAFVCFVLAMAVFPITASADIGPKPSLEIDFIGLSGETYYVTLLSSVESTGPHCSLSYLRRDNPDVADKDWYYGAEEDYPIYLRFLDFETADVDGYYFLQFFQNCSDTDRFSWNYYPPPNFKILLYFPDKDSFMVSAESYDRYAFSSYFTATVDREIQPGTSYDGGIEVRKSYDYRGEILSLIARIILTIAIELLIALLFVFRQKKQLLFISAVNLFTQIALNVALNFINFNYGPLAFVFAFVLLELAVFIIEAILYTTILRTLSEAIVPKWKTITYAFVANAASFALGLGLAYIIPGIF